MPTKFNKLFFVFGYVKYFAHKNKPTNIPALKGNVTNANSEISPKKLYGMEKSL